MYKKTITYTDYDGNERTEDFYFNISKAEITQIQFKTPGGFTGKIDRVIKAREVSELIQLFEEFIDLAYGVKTPDGKRFIKNQETLDAFRQSEAYSELYMELATNTDSAIAFINGIMPKLTPEQQAEVDRQIEIERAKLEA